MTARDPASITIGQRVTLARASLEREPDCLPKRAGIGAPELTAIEAGDRLPGPAELVGIANSLGLPPDWFLTDPPPVVMSLRAERIEGPPRSQVDLLLESLARDIEQLHALGLLTSISHAERLPPPHTPQEAEAAAAQVRRWIGNVEDPLLDLDRAFESFGLTTFCTALPPGHPDGAYLALERSGAALINGSQEPGRRRFTLAHEFGHHLFQDSYSTDWSIGAGSEATEKLINAFAVHLLLPAPGLRARWQALGGEPEPRRALAALAIEYRVSWSAITSHCNRVGLVAASFRDQPAPGRAELQDFGLAVHPELVPPSLSPPFVQAVLTALRKNRITERRAREMLRNTADSLQMPATDEIPLAAFRAEIEVA